MRRNVMNAGDANMWYRNCTIRVFVDGERRAALIGGFRDNLSITAHLYNGFDKEDNEPRYREVTVTPENYELDMPRAGYFVDRDGDLIYLELRAMKTIRRAMFMDRICRLNCKRVSTSYKKYLALEAMMVGRVDERILTDVLAIDGKKIMYRGIHIGTAKNKGITLAEDFLYLEEYVNHAINS